MPRWRVQAARSGSRALPATAAENGAAPSRAPAGCEAAGAHHVFEQHGQHAGQEGAQHVLVHLALAKGGPELAGLHRDALVLILQPGRHREWASDEWLAGPGETCPGKPLPASQAGQARKACCAGISHRRVARREGGDALSSTWVDLSMYSIRSGSEGCSRSGTAISIVTRPMHTALRTAGAGSTARVNRPCRKLHAARGRGGAGRVGCTGGVGVPGRLGWVGGGAASPLLGLRASPRPLPSGWPKPPLVLAHSRAAGPTCPYCPAVRAA